MHILPCSFNLHTFH